MVSQIYTMDVIQYNIKFFTPTCNIKVQCFVQEGISQKYARTAFFDDVSKLLHGKNNMYEARLAMNIKRCTKSRIDLIVYKKLFYNDLFVSK